MCSSHEPCRLCMLWQHTMGKLWRGLSFPGIHMVVGCLENGPASSCLFSEVVAALLWGQIWSAFSTGGLKLCSAKEPCDIYCRVPACRPWRCWLKRGWGVLPTWNFPEALLLPLFTSPSWGCCRSCVENCWKIMDLVEKSFLKIGENLCIFWGKKIDASFWNASSN